MDDAAFVPVPSILPQDGRFGSGPTRIRPEQISALAHAPLGTSHRARPVIELVSQVRAQLAELMKVPEGYEIALGNGGASLMWEALTFSLVRERAAHAVCGEFGGKFAALTDAAPHLADSIIHRAEPGQWVGISGADDADTLAFAHNETSTGVLSPLGHVGERDADQLVVVDATSIAGALSVDLTGIDVYYFSAQKALGSDGGLWFAALSPAAIERIERVTRERWVPPMLNLATALNNSRKDQTYNTPAIATLALLAGQLDYLIERGGLAAAEAHCRGLSESLYIWAEGHDRAASFVAEPRHRSPVVATIDLFDVDADAVRAELAARAGIVDIAPYRSLGRNQIRVGCYPSVDAADVAALIEWLEWALAR